MTTTDHFDCDRCQTFHPADQYCEPITEYPDNWPQHTGEPCPRCGCETDTDKCGPLYCPRCGWQNRSCTHGLAGP